MDVSDLAALSSLLAAEVRHRLQHKPTNRQRREMSSTVLAEIGLGEIKIRRALYTLRRRIAVHERTERLSSKAIK